MITIKKIVGIDFCEPERPLTSEEKEKIIIGWGGVNEKGEDEYWYFEEQDKDPKSEHFSKWRNYQEHISQPAQEIREETTPRIFCKSMSEDEEKQAWVEIRKFFSKEPS